MNTNDALGYFQAIARDFISGNIDAVCQRAELPVAVYLPEHTVVFDDRDRLAHAVQMYFNVLSGLGVANCTIAVVRQEARHGAESCFRVRARYARVDGSLVGESNSLYFLVGSGKDMRVRMVEVDKLPVDKLPFNPEVLM